MCSAQYSVLITRYSVLITYMHEYIDFDAVDQYGPQERKQTLSIPGEEFARDEVERFDRVLIEARAQKGDLEKEYLVEGSIDAKGLLRCSRCLEAFPFANASSFHLRYRPQPPAKDPDAEIEIALGEFDVEYYTDRRVELGEIAAEQLQLSIPMKPLCGEGCPGLCPRCGTNLNQQKCSCSLAARDERWEPLHEIREKLARKKQ